MTSQDFYKSIHDELFDNILPYWENYSRDTRPGFEGFFGQIDNDRVADTRINRGKVYACLKLVGLDFVAVVIQIVCSWVKAPNVHRSFRINRRSRTIKSHNVYSP